MSDFDTVRCPGPPECQLGIHSHVHKAPMTDESGYEMCEEDCTGNHNRHYHITEADMESGIRFAPSEEYSLHCDVKGCEAGLSMPSEIPRQWHGWGRISLYSDVGGDLDLCPEHLKAVWAVLTGE